MGVAIYLKLSLVKLLVMVIAMIFVISLELLNTAIESTVDLIVPQTYHPLAKIAKDSAAGVVMLLAGMTLLITSLMLIPPLFKFTALGMMSH